MSLEIAPILCLKGMMDNYAYVITDTQSGACAVVDASEAAPIEEYCDSRGLKPEFILVTHHHDDHVGGNAALKQKYGCKIVASAVDAVHLDDADITVHDGETFNLGQISATVIAVAGHTNGHILWYFEQDKALFTGDTLFNLSVGGLFEGTPWQMWQSLQKIKSLPDDVCFYPGHEYTRAGFAGLLRNPTPAAAEYRHILEQKMQKGEPPVGIPLGLEKKCNPYLKIDDENVFIRYFAGG
ncbi:MAG: hydroxyacylglutathione hydrolase [Alphaproteobacteria bacterium]|nr:hydroxyacylglutathione hydrolase [Alphaproteobacteria bacterium]